MAITGYSSLQTAVADWLARSDLTAYIPDFIAAAEQEIFFGTDDPAFPYDGLRVRQMESTATLSLSTNPVSLPADFLEQRRLYINDTNRTPLSAVSPEQLLTDYPNSATGRPQEFAIEGNGVRFGPDPDSAYDARLLYYAKPDPLATTSTNGVISAYPMVYLYAALAASAPFTQNDDRLQTWKRLAAAAVNGANGQAKAGRWSGSIRIKPDRSA